MTFYVEALTGRNSNNRDKTRGPGRTAFLRFRRHHPRLPGVQPLASDQSIVTLKTDRSAASHFAQDATCGCATASDATAVQKQRF